MTDFLNKYIDIERFIHSIKTTIACLIGFSFSRFIGFPSDQWIVITIIVVMCAQIYVGSVVQKAYLRFLGTALGCLLAAIALEYFGHSGVVIALTIGFSSFIFSYLATGQESFNYTGTLGAVTTAIIMLGAYPNTAFALERFLEISIGLLIAFLVSQFILPIHARNHLRRSQTDTLEKLRDYYLLIIEQDKSEELAAVDYHDLDEQIVKTLLKQRQLAKETIQERFGPKFDSIQFTQFLYYEREILRSITFMQNAMLHLSREESSFIYSDAAKEFNNKITDGLNSLIKHLKNPEEAEHIHVPSLTSLQTELHQLAAQPSQSMLIYSNAFLFAAGIITMSLKSLAKLYRLPIYEEDV